MKDHSCRCSFCGIRFSDLQDEIDIVKDINKKLIESMRMNAHVNGLVMKNLESYSNPQYD